MSDSLSYTNSDETSAPLPDDPKWILEANILGCDVLPQSNQKQTPIWGSCNLKVKNYCMYWPRRPITERLQNSWWC